MATRFEIVLAGQPVHRLRAAGEAALDEIVGCHRRLTRFATDSLVAHITRRAVEQPVRLDEDTFALFQDALRIQQATSGAFSISMTGCPAFELDDASRSIRLLEPGVVLDLGAIAKGHALDVAVRVLREADVDCALLHGGTSSVHAMGAPPDSAGWRIRLAHAPQAPPRVLRNRALSVSGTTGPVAVGGSRAHLRDGRDGSIVRTDRFAMVEGHSAREADGWATAIAVLGHRPAGLDAHWYASIVEPDV